MSADNGKRPLWTTKSIEQFFAHSGIAFLVVSSDRKMVDVNPAFCDMLGYRRDEVIGKSVDDITYRDDQGMTNRLFREVRGKNVTISFEKRYLAKNGSLIWCKGRSEPIDDFPGDMVYRLVMLENINMRKQKELTKRQIAAIVDASEDAMFCTGKDGGIIFWNKGAEHLYGYRTDEVLGKPAAFLAANPFNDEELELFRRLMAGEVIRYPSAMSRHKDGHVIEVSVAIFPLRNAQGERIAHAAVHRDVSELRRLGEQLRLSQRMETAGMLAGAIAHDFNNILTVIKGSCDVLAQELPELLEGGRYLDLIERSAEKAAVLTRQLLTFSRRQKISQEILDPNDELARLRPLMQRALGEDIALDARLQSSWRIREDPTQFEQIVLNISVNARQAMPKGGRLTISTADVTLEEQLPATDPGWDSFVPEPVAPGRYVQITIQDEGIGMARDVIERIFEPFFTTKGEGQSTGLGLSVVFGIVTQGGGGIQVLSKHGVGTAFRIFLPRVEAVVTAPVKTAPVPATGDKRGRILVMDDDANVRGLVVRVLEYAGYQVTQAGSAEEVLANETLADVDLIISDVVMPGLSGPEFSRRWLQLRPQARFLFISGYIEDAGQTDILAAGNFLAKPFKPATLLQKVEAELADAAGA
ncbi:MAG TPA: PAS domain S-box protein [Candidatus Acidoferrum sp.]|nr:PAS domain S-box protein [Candidatus Acidoferrum sp.]